MSSDNNSVDDISHSESDSFNQNDGEAWVPPAGAPENSPFDQDEDVIDGNNDSSIVPAMAARASGGNNGGERAGQPAEEDEGAERVLGKDIRDRHPNDLHFLCSCRSFHPCDNKDFRDLLRDLAREDSSRNNSSHNRETKSLSVSNVLEKANLKAQEVKHSIDAKFRIWCPYDPTQDSGTKKIKEVDWRTFWFEDITDNPRKVKNLLESPIRTASKNPGSHPAPDVEPNPPPKRAKKDPLPSPEATNQNTMNSGNNSIPSFPADDSFHPESVFLNPFEPSPESIVEEFLAVYRGSSYQNALNRLYDDRKDRRATPRDMEKWAEDLYKTFERNPLDGRAMGLDDDRRVCLDLLYRLVKAWDNSGHKENFEKAIRDIFQRKRLERILSICLPMDRAQALHKLQHGINPPGLRWFCDLHLEEDNEYGRVYRGEQEEWIGKIYGLPCPPEATMNKKLFRLLFCDSFRLRTEDLQHLSDWSRPAEVPSDAKDFPSDAEDSTARGL